MKSAATALGVDAGGIPPPTDPAVARRSIREALETVDTEYAEAYLQAVVAGLQAEPPKSAPFVELVTRYRVGKPPESGDSARPPLVFLLSHGAPGGYDPLAVARPSGPPVIDVTPVPTAPPPLSQRAATPPAPAVRPEDPDELVPIRS